MASISIQKTKNIAASIDYVLGKNDERVMCRSGHNVNPYDAKFQMRDLQFQFGKEKGFIQGYTFVQSFSLNDFPNKNDKENLELANKITLETLKALDPNTQTLVVTHNDGESGLIHCHGIQNAVQLDGKSRRRNMNFQTVAKKSDEICLKHGLSVLDNYKEYQKENGEITTYIDTNSSQPKSHHWIQKRNKRTDYEILQNKINDVKSTATSKEEFQTLMFEVHNVDVNFRVRGGKNTVSYKMLDDDVSKKMKHRISGKKLGNSYDFESLNQCFSNNLDELQKRNENSLNSLLETMNIKDNESQQNFSVIDKLAKEYEEGQHGRETSRKTYSRDFELE